MHEPEEPLVGGLEEGRVVKVGDTVRRPAGPWTPTVHALLRHLQAKGFPSPRPLGLDDQGREILSFLPGRCSSRPWPPGLLTQGGAGQVGALLRDYHAAVADFRPPEPLIWRHGAHDLAPGEIVLHGDYAPHNLIWSGEVLTGVIDFELARPGRPIEDAVYAMIRVAHLRPDDVAPPTGLPSPIDRAGRIGAFAGGFGCPVETLVAGALAAQRAELERIEGWGGRGLEPWATFLRLGLAEQVRIELRWMDANLASFGLA